MIRLLLASVLLLPRVTRADAGSRLLRAYVGDYQIRQGTIVFIRQNGDTLTVQVRDRPVRRAYPEPASGSFFINHRVTVEFAPPEGGHSPTLVLHQNGRDITAYRVASRP